MRAGEWILGGAAAAALGVLPWPAAGAASPPLRPQPATITHVEDGRTLWIGAPGASPFKARLAWIAVPAGPGGNSKGGRQGAEARQHLGVWKDRPVEFVVVGRDAGGLPLLELLWRPTADSIITLNYEMVRSGFARADCAMSGDYAIQCRLLRRAEDIARKERRGIWDVR